MKVSLLCPPPPETWSREHGEAELAGLAEIARQLGYASLRLSAPLAAPTTRAIRRCAEAGAPLHLPPLAPTRERRLVALYAALSRRAPGQGVAHLRDLLVADSDERALELWAATGRSCGRPWYEEPGPAGANLFEDSLALVGSVDTVRRQLDALCARSPVRELVAWIYPGRIPARWLVRSLELFALEVLPALARHPTGRRARRRRCSPRTSAAPRRRAPSAHRPR